MIDLLEDERRAQRPSQWWVKYVAVILAGFLTGIGLSVVLR